MVEVHDSDVTQSTLFTETANAHCYGNIDINVCPI